MSESTEFSQRVMPLSRKIFAVAYHILQQGDEAEDVVQDIFVKLWEMRDKMPPDKMLEAYVLTMTRNLCIDRIRSRRETVEYNDGQGIDPSLDNPDTLIAQGGEETTDACDDSDPVESRDKLRMTLQLMKELPPDQEKVLRLKVFDELQNEQIAHLLNIKEDNVRQLLSRARRRLKELAIKQGVI